MTREKETDERGTVRLNNAQLDALKGGINAVRGAVNKTAEAIAPVQDKESISAKLGAITELVRNLQLNVTFDTQPIVDALNAGFEDLGKWIGAIDTTNKEGFAAVVAALNNQQPGPPPAQQLEVKFMFVVKNDHPPEPFSIVLGEVTDAEGNVIPDAKVDVEVISTNEDAVSVEFDAEARTGIASFGNAGVSALQATVSSGGKLLGSGAADFTVTLGDPDAVSGIALSFPGLTEAPPPEEPPV